MTGRQAIIKLAGSEVARVEAYYAADPVVTTTSEAPDGLVAMVRRIFLYGFLSPESGTFPAVRRYEQLSVESVARTVDEIAGLWPGGLGLEVVVEDVG